MAADVSRRLWLTWRTNPTGLRGIYVIWQGFRREDRRRLSGSIRKHSMSGTATSWNARTTSLRKKVPTTGRVDVRRRPLTTPNLFQEAVTTRRSSGIGLRSRSTVNFSIQLLMSNKNLKYRLINSIVIVNCRFFQYFVRNKVFSSSTTFCFFSLINNFISILLFDLKSDIVHPFMIEFYCNTSLHTQITDLPVLWCAKEHDVPRKNLEAGDKCIPLAQNFTFIS